MLQFELFSICFQILKCNLVIFAGVFQEIDRCTVQAMGHHFDLNLPKIFKANRLIIGPASVLI